MLATEWNEFRALNFERVRKAMRAPVVIDLRNVYDPHRMASLGFHYTSVGRPLRESAPPPAGRKAAE